jgi:spore germination protein YaaH
MTKRQVIFFLAALLIAVTGVAGCGIAFGGQPAERSTPRTLQTVAGYVVPWDSRSVAAIRGGTLTEVSPVWYQPLENGKLAFASNEAQQSQAKIEALASSDSVAVLPTISNYVDNQWDGRLIHRLLSDPQLRAAHVAAIAALARSGRWAGIDLDYESLMTQDRGAYSAFVRDVAAALHHEGKRLTLTVHAKTAEPGDWSGARAQDWRALGAAADEVRVMAYDYSTETSSPGPIAPVGWVKSVLQLAVAEVPRDKIVLGLATYGYDWANGQPTQDLQTTDAVALAEAHGVPVKWDTSSQCPWFAYTDDQGHPHTVWYENAQSLKAKLNLALSYHIGGVFLWQLGGEDPAIWGPLHAARWGDSAVGL